jgi:hypothetical protein
VGRGTAERLAREKPEVCRRCLEYLPFAKVKTTKGAWLANAIRDEYGPPEGYLRSCSPAERAIALNGRLRPPEPSQATIERQARDSYRRLEKTQPGAITAFLAHVADERQRTERFATRLSERRRQECMASFDSEEHRLRLFSRWVASEGRGVVRQVAPAVAIVPITVSGPEDTRQS